MSVFQQGQDWNYVTLGGRGQKKTAEERKEELKQLQRTDPSKVTTEQKYGAGKNPPRTGPSNAKKLENAEEAQRIKTVSNDLRLNIQKARQQKGWSQKEFANAVQEQVKVIAEYEAGTAQPNGQLISKMERALGVHLRGQHALEPLSGPSAKKAAAPAPKGK